MFGWAGATQVVDLCRVRFGAVRLGALWPGEARAATAAEAAWAEELIRQWERQRGGGVRFVPAAAVALPPRFGRVDHGPCCLALLPRCSEVVLRRLRACLPARDVAAVEMASRAFRWSSADGCDGGGPCPLSNPSLVVTDEADLAVKGAQLAAAGVPASLPRRANAKSAI